MPKSTMLKSDLIHQIAMDLDEIPKHVIQNSLSTLMEIMIDMLASGGRVEIRGFGTWATHILNQRVGRDPKQGTAITIPAKRRLRFKMSKEIKELLETL